VAPLPTNAPHLRRTKLETQLLDVTAPYQATPPSRRRAQFVAGSTPAARRPFIRVIRGPSESWVDLSSTLLFPGLTANHEPHRMHERVTNHGSFVFFVSFVVPAKAG